MEKNGQGDLPAVCAANPMVLLSNYTFAYILRCHKRIPLNCSLFLPDASSRKAFSKPSCVAAFFYPFRTLDQSPIALSPLPGGHFEARGKEAFVDISTLARLRSIYQGLTSAQHAQLMAIARCDNQQLSMPLCESLVALGLIRLAGNKYFMTEDGRYSASLR